MCVLKPPSSAYSITEAVQLWQRRLYAPVAVGAISVLRRCFVVSLWFFFVFVFVLSSHYCCAMITMILMARSFLRLPPSDWLLSVAAVFELFSRFVLVERGNNWMDFPPTSHSFDRFLWKLIESNCLFFFRSRLASQFFLGSHFRAIKCFSIYGSSFEFF